MSVELFSSSTRLQGRTRVSTQVNKTKHTCESIFIFPQYREHTFHKHIPNETPPVCAIAEPNKQQWANQSLHAGLSITLWVCSLSTMSQYCFQVHKIKWIQELVVLWSSLPASRSLASLCTAPVTVSQQPGWQHSQLLLLLPPSTAHIEWLEANIWAGHPPAITITHSNTKTFLQKKVKSNVESTSLHILSK